jgi:peptide deformylase
MGVLSIVTLPDEVLLRKAEEIDNIDDHIVTLAKDMAETMYKAPGVGLAANQVGRLLRLIVVDVEYAYMEPQNRAKNPIFIINPKISAIEGSVSNEEGCLSVPEFNVEIKRSERVQVEGVGLDGNPIGIEADGLFARALQHEIDHLNGTTILQHASALKRNMYNRKLRKNARRNR